MPETDPINRDCLYTKKGAMERLNIGEDDWIAMCRRGLMTFKEGRGVFVKGEDMIAHICRDRVASRVGGGTLRRRTDRNDTE